MSRFVRARSDDARIDSMADKLEGSDMDDPRELRRFAREMGREMGAETGEDMSEELEAMIEAEANGEEGEGGLWWWWRVQVGRWHDLLNGV